MKMNGSAQCVSDCVLRKRSRWNLLNTDKCGLFTIKCPLQPWESLAPPKTPDPHENLPNLQITQKMSMPGVCPCCPCLPVGARAVCACLSGPARSAAATNSWRPRDEEGGAEKEKAKEDKVYSFPEATAGPVAPPAAHHSRGGCPPPWLGGHTTRVRRPAPGLWRGTRGQGDTQVYSTQCGRVSRRAVRHAMPLLSAAGCAHAPLPRSVPHCFPAPRPGVRFSASPAGARVLKKRMSAKFYV